MGRTTAITAMLLLAASASPGAGPLTAVERQRLIAHLDMTERWLADEVSRLSAAQLAFRPTPDGWSILQVVDHLVVVGPIYWQDLQKAMQGPPGTAIKSGTDADILWYGIDRTSREKAIPSEVPKGETRTLAAMLDSYRRSHARLLEYARTTTDDLRAHFVVRQGCDAYQWALLISTHEQRHVQQIREIKKDASFPRP